MNEIWTQRSIGDLVANGEAHLKTGPFGTQLHASDYVETGTPVINVRNIGNGGIRQDQLEFISQDTVERLSAHLLEPNDIVFGRKGAVDRHAFILLSHKHWFQGSDCLRLRLNSPSLDARFASYTFLTDAHKAWMHNQCSHGATMASLNQDILCRIQLRYPPLPTQRKIAAILSAYDDLIENNTRRIKILEDMAQTIYREWFVNFRFPGHEKIKMVESELGLIPEGWEVNRLGNLAKEVRRSVNPDRIAPETPYFGLEHLPRKSIALSDWGYVRDVQSTKLAFNKGEILFGKIRPYFHKVGVAPLDGVCSSDAIVIVPMSEVVYPLVLCTVSSVDFVDHATQTSQGTKMPRANWKVLVNYPVIMPPRPIIEQFNHIVNDAVELIQNLVLRNRNLRQTRDMLLPTLISGEVDVSEMDIVVGEEAK